MSRARAARRRALNEDRLVRCLGEFLVPRRQTVRRVLDCGYIHTVCVDCLAKRAASKHAARRLPQRRGIEKPGP